MKSHVKSTAVEDVAGSVGMAANIEIIFIIPCSSLRGPEGAVAIP